MLRQLVGALPTSSDKRILKGFENAEDGAVYQIDDNRALILTVDVITPIVDEPERFGAIAAANALSDVFAMGGRGLASLSFLSISSEVSPLVATRIVTGGCELAMEAGAPVLGGHSVEGRDILFGLAVVGEAHPEQILTNDALRPGDQLVLTKPLGTGTLSTAYKRGLLTKGDMSEAVTGMICSNGKAVPIMHAYQVRAATDVTGFGLLGHGAEMAHASGVGLVIEAQAVPAYSGARHALASGIVTKGNTRNSQYVDDLTTLQGVIDPLLLDPQTSGGLLIAVTSDHLGEMIRDLRHAGYKAASHIGEVVAGAGIELV